MDYMFSLYVTNKLKNYQLLIIAVLRLLLERAIYF